MSNCTVSADSHADKCDQLCEAIHTTALATFGKRISKSSDWFKARSSMVTSVIVAKWNALTDYRCLPNEKSLYVLRNARNKVQQTARCCTNGYWLELCKNILNAAVSGDIKEMYDVIKKALGTTQSKVAYLKSATGEVINDRAKQMKCWIEHYSELYLENKHHHQEQQGKHSEAST